MKNKVIIAFPGCGKTTATKTLISQGVRALDFDCKGLRKGDVPLNTRFARGYYKRGYYVFINNALVNLHKFPKDTHIVFYIPNADREDWVERIEKRGDCQEFIDELRLNYFRWASDLAAAIMDLRISGYNKVEVIHLGKDEYINVTDILA